MQLKTEAELLAYLKQGITGGIYLLYGEESYLVELYARKFCKSTEQGPMPEFNYHVFSSEGFSVDELSDFVQALPWMAELKCAWVRGLEADKLSTTEFSKLEELMQDFPAYCLLVITLRGEISKHAKTAKLIKLCDQYGVSIRLARRTGSDLVKYIKGMVQKSGCTIESKTAQYLIERCSDDMELLKNEVDKLTAYVPNGQITTDTIDKVTIRAIEARAFDLSRAILRKDYDKAMAVLDDLLYQRESAVLILAALSSSFIDLYRAKVASAEDKDIKEIVSDFGYRGKEFRVRNALSDHRKYETSYLRTILFLLTEADEKLKSVKTEDRTVLEETIVKIFIAGERA